MLGMIHDTPKGLSKRIARALAAAAENLPTAGAAFAIATAISTAIGLTVPAFALAGRWLDRENAN